MYNLGLLRKHYSLNIHYSNIQKYLHNSSLCLLCKTSCPNKMYGLNCKNVIINLTFQRETSYWLNSLAM